MKKTSSIVIVFIFAILYFSNYANAKEVKIKCDCVYGEKITENFRTKQILNRNESLVNTSKTYYFYIDDIKKQIFDSEHRQRKTLTFNRRSRGEADGLR